MIRLVIVDDHPIVRGGLRDTFAGVDDIRVVGEAGNGLEGVERAKQLAADVILMDLRMPESDGVTATAVLREELPHARVLILTTFDNESDVLPAIEAGAAGYLLKDALPEELEQAVRAAARGESVLAPSVTRHLMRQVQRTESGTLTDREKQVLQLVANGSSNKDAASALFIGEASIKTHLQHIYDKLGVRDRASAVAEGYRRRLLS
ncbi:MULTISPECIES: response regulator [Microbacterium]|uniref:Response regulator transcription factor n=1 Tax=Microbacterium wangchenii TaxID=2541726 RepID=A0ABX5SXQ9_9MICO|nr:MULTISPECIES: response regulator transcription factor [Microbacterium]MCK6068491.1 response regulator transcription factor [Microbacterium sp. EYE_512]QBR90040.1 response regulator transcription factor [Microbacterium wangchenii]TFV85108.1 response regulator transcription factor [Microbacterium sp. dk485]TXK09240.1 response regulator transcription factor [Microbacterium wangchenii]